MDGSTDDAERLRLLTTLSDARLYLKQSHVAAAIEMLVEDVDSFSRAPDLAEQALLLVDDAYLYFAGPAGNDMDAAAKAVDQLFDFAAACFASVRSLDKKRLATYKRALLLTRNSALPLRRVLRQTSLIKLLETTAGLDGAVAECGCFRGMSSMQMALSIAAGSVAWRGERFHIIDSFEGLSQPSDHDLDFSGMDASEAKRVMSMTRSGNMAASFDSVSKLMWAHFPEMNLHGGWIPAVFMNLPSERYRFVNVDVDLYEPTLASFEYFLPRLVSGGVIVTDDYNWPGGRKAVDEFCVKNGLQLHFTAAKLAFIKV